VIIKVNLVFTDGLTMKQGTVMLVVVLTYQGGLVNILIIIQKRKIRILLSTGHLLNMDLKISLSKY